jgi:hypothetical protein
MALVSLNRFLSGVNLDVETLMDFSQVELDLWAIDAICQVDAFRIVPA